MSLTIITLFMNMDMGFMYASKKMVISGMVVLGVFCYLRLVAGSLGHSEIKKGFGTLGTHWGAFGVLNFWDHCFTSSFATRKLVNNKLAVLQSESAE